MILVFGGTTEGRKAVSELEESGRLFYYSTKSGEQDITLHHGIRIDGALDEEKMATFCLDHAIRLIIDAAHPFATLLHSTIVCVARRLNLPAIRFERLYPPRAHDICWCDDYSHLPNDIHTLLATTGVQSISRLRYLEERGVKVFYRILPRKSSLALALHQGVDENHLCYYQEGEDEMEAMKATGADAILLKESGMTGGFTRKVEAARQLGLRIIAIRRPPTDTYFHIVDGEHGLRRMVEQLLPDFFPLHSGLTTGTCATAAAVAATRRLLWGECPEKVGIQLPNGETIAVAVGYPAVGAKVVKDAGDDPDVTDGMEIRAEVSFVPRDPSELGNSTAADSEEKFPIIIKGGKGVGTFTLPGFDYPPGEPAINKAPRQMIISNLTPLLAASHCHDTLQVTISVPGGEETALRTFNPRLGIQGGISIIGVSGIVKPFSEEAFIDSIRKCMTVAHASGSQRVVINSGAKSERYIKSMYPDLPPQAFVEYGNYIGATLKEAHALGFRKVTLGVMMGKAVKLAEGHLDTHSRKVTMNKDFIAQMLQESGCTSSTIHRANGMTLARELWDIVPASQIDAFCDTVIRHCQAHCAPLLPQGELTIFLIDEHGNIHALSHP